MTPQQAKEILALYRPGTADASDPDFAAALQVCENDPELNRWFQAHCELHTAIRAKLREARPPEGLREQILSERPSRPARQILRPTLVLAGAILLLTLGVIFLSIKQPRETNLADYRNRMTSTALRAYSMDLETSDLNQIQEYLAGQRSVSDYTLPNALLQKAEPVGCVALSWEGEPVAMICFASGRPRKPGEKSDLFLFVTTAPLGPTSNRSESPFITPVSRAATAVWSEGGKHYLLVANGDEAFLKEYLQDSNEG